MNAPAVWTPWATVECRACSRDARRPSSLGFELTPLHWARIEEHATHDGWCSQCGAAVVLDRADVAQMSRLRKIIGGGDLWQTGGMCACLVVQQAMLAGAPYDSTAPLVVLGENVIGLYPHEDAFNDGGGEHVDVDGDDEVVLASLRHALATVTRPS